KPHVLGHLLFYNYLQKIFEQKPLSEEFTLQTFLIKKLKRFNKYLRKNHKDYAYYQHKGTKYDELYFVRCNLQAEDYHSHPYSMVDSDFATSKDYLFANFIAHEKIIVYLENELVKLKVNKKIRYKSQLEILKASSYNWSETKIAMVELIYALVYSGCINNGNVDVKELSKTLCELFHVEDLDIYRSFIDLKYRKKNPTVFLDKMKEGLLKKLEEY
ncbi:RteC domain-containing protein, partial [Carboxylicivirga linearis]